MISHWELNMLPLPCDDLYQSRVSLADAGLPRYTDCAFKNNQTGNPGTQQTSVQGCQTIFTRKSQTPTKKNQEKTKHILSEICGKISIFSWNYAKNVRWLSKVVDDFTNFEEFVRQFFATKVTIIRCVVLIAQKARKKSWFFSLCG